MVITAHAGGSFAAASLPPFSTGVCTFVDTVVGIEKEEGQDRLSVLVSFFFLIPQRSDVISRLTKSTYTYRGSGGAAGPVSFISCGWCSFNNHRVQQRQTTKRVLWLTTHARPASLPVSFALPPNVCLKIVS